MLKKSHKTVIIIPAFNEAGVIGKVVSGAAASLPDADIVVIDDGSSDTTAEIARKTGAITLRLSLNCGYGVALQTGYKYAEANGYKFILQMDADGQHESEYLQHIFRALSENDVDIVIGSRFLNNESYQPPPIRRIGMRFFASLASLVLRQKITDPTSGFIGINSRALPFLVSGYFPTDYPDADVIIMLHKRGFKIREISVKMHSGSKGSMHRGLRPLYYIYKMLLSMFISLISKSPECHNNGYTFLPGSHGPKARKIALDFLHDSSVPMSSFIMNIASAIERMGHDVFLLTESGSLNERLARFHGFQTVSTLHEYKFDIAFIDNGRMPNQQNIFAYHRCEDIVYFEFGYLPYTIQVDRRGVNADASFNVESKTLFDIRRFVNWQKYTKFAKIRRYPVNRYVTATWLIRNPGFILNIARYISRKSLRHLAAPAHRLDLPDRFFFIPLQVHNDTQIIHHSPYIRFMADILDFFHEQIIANFPGYSIVVKEHPYDSGVFAYRKLRKRYPDLIWLRKYDFDELVRRCSAMITINSSSGFKALAQHKRVLTLGNCFYNKNSFVEHVDDPALFIKRLKALMEKQIDYAALDEYIDHFRQNIFVDGHISPNGDISHLTQKTIAQVLSYIFEEER